MKDMSAYAQSGVAVTFPAWAQFLTSSGQVVIGLMGFAVLCLTIYNKILEARQRGRDLRTNKPRIE